MVTCRLATYPKPEFTHDRTKLWCWAQRRRRKQNQKVAAVDNAPLLKTLIMVSWRFTSRYCV